MKNHKLNKILEVPKEVYTNEPKITVTGFNELEIENYKGIIEYEEYFVRIKTHIGIININGINLKLEKMNEDELKIVGEIESMEFERLVD